MNIEHLIKNKSHTISEIFSNIAEQGVYKKLNFKIDENKFDNRYLDQVNITLSGDFVDMFKELQRFEDLPAVYYFEINPFIPKDEIITLIKDVNTEHLLNIPAQNNNQNNSGTLYVGKVKSCAWGRLIQHIGFHKNRRSHGLQLNYWVKKTSLKIDLSFTILFFEKIMENYIDIIEIEVAKSLKPIIGKH